MSAITAKASRKMKKYAVLTREPRCFLGSFDFSWEQRKLNEVVNVYDGVHQTPDYKESGVMFLSVENISTLKSEKYISEEAFQRDYKVYPQKGDILMTRIGDVGTPNVVETTEKVAFYVSLALLKPTKINSYFLCNSIQSPLFQKGLKDRTLVTAIPQKINKDEIGKVNIILPTSSQEQQLIGEYFANLDRLITLHQRKCVFLFGFFQAFISMIFTASTFSWEQRKLSELTSMHARIGWQNLRTSEFLDSGDYMLITGTDFNDGAINFSTCHYVERERYEQDRNIQIHNGSILITKDGTLGKVAYVQGLSMPATLNAGVFNVQIKDANNVDERYLFQYLKAPFLMDYVDKKATGGTIKHLNQSILVDFPVILPQRSEQILIGAFFQQLDNLITLHQRKGKAAVSGCFLNYSSLEKSSAQSRTLELFGQTSNQEIKYIIDGLSILGGKLRNFCVKLIILLSYTRINDIAKYHISRNTECVHNIN